MKRLSLFVAAVLVATTICGCSSKKDETSEAKTVSETSVKKAAQPEELSDAFIKSDVQDYIAEMIDSDAEIVIFEKVSSEISGAKMVVVCNAIFDNGEEENRGEFTLIYKAENDSWVLSSCSVELAEKDEDKEDKEDKEEKEEVKEDKKDEEEKEEKKEEEKKEEAEEEKKEENKSDTSSTTVSDKLLDFQFMLDGVVYTLPCKYTDFKDNGWVISSRGVTENDDIKANTYTYLSMIKDGNSITVYVNNFSGNSKTIKNCKVGGIDVSRYNLTDASFFGMPKGITLDSSVEDITAAYGAANSNNTYDEYVFNTYTLDTQRDVRFTTYTNGTTKYNSVTIRNFVKDESDVTETNTEVPEYLASYVAPLVLGDDPLSGIIEIDGDIYSLPAPVSAFTNNGWKITQQSNSVGSGNTDSIRLERNGKKIYVYITNLASYQTIPANCAVYRVYIYDTDKVPVKLPGGISMETNKADVESFVSDEFSYDKGSSSYNYNYSNYDVGFSLYIRVNIETEKVNYISLSCEKWDY